jgi:protein SCO1
MTSQIHKHPGFIASLLLFATLASSAEPSPTLKAGVFTPANKAPEFALQGSSGATVKLSDYRGKVVVVGFGYTSCPEVCPTTLAVLAQARRKLGDAARDLRVLYVTVDPERDSVQRLEQYLGTFDTAFVGLTGTSSQLASVRQQYGVLIKRENAAQTYFVGHSTSTYLIDRTGRLRALMPYGRSVSDYVHDLSILLQEAPVPPAASTAADKTR